MVCRGRDTSQHPKMPTADVRGGSISGWGVRIRRQSSDIVVSRLFKIIGLVTPVATRTNPYNRQSEMLAVLRFIMLAYSENEQISSFQIV